MWKDLEGLSAQTALRVPVFAEEDAPLLWAQESLTLSSSAYLEVSSISITICLREERQGTVKMTFLILLLLRSQHATFWGSMPQASSLPQDIPLPPLLLHSEDHTQARTHAGHMLSYWGLSFPAFLSFLVFSFFTKPLDCITLSEYITLAFSQDNFQGSFFCSLLPSIIKFNLFKTLK